MSNLKLTLNSKRLNDFIKLEISDHSYTFFNEIFKIKPAHYLSLKGNRLDNQARYFNFKEILKIKGMSLQEAAKHIKRSLIYSTEYDESYNKKTGVLFSGGIDSSSIISILASKHKLIYGISAVYDDLPIKNLHLINESNYQDHIFNKYPNIKKYQFEASNLSILDSIDRYLKIIGEPFFFPNLYLTDKSYEYAYKNNIEVVFNGNDGDTIISHGYETLFYYFISFKWIRLYTELKKISLLRGVKVKTIFKRLVYDRYIKFMLNQIFRPKNFQRKVYLSPYKNHLESINSTLHQDAIYKHSCLALYYGIEEKYPFYDPNLISSSIQVPSKYKLYKGVSRFILREAMKDYVPKENIERMTKSNLGHALCFNIIKNESIFYYEFSRPHKILSKLVDIDALKIILNV